VSPFLTFLIKLCLFVSFPLFVCLFVCLFVERVLLIYMRYSLPSICCCVLFFILFIMPLSHIIYPSSLPQFPSFTNAYPCAAGALPSIMSDARIPTHPTN